MTPDSKEQAYQYHYIGQEGRKQPFNKGWRFLRADVQLAQDPSFDDSNWSYINLPHDFSLAQPYTRNGEAESAYKLGGVGWYRHYLVLDEELAGCHVALTFEGSYMETEVYVNGQFIGKHLNGYQEFTYDISGAVTFGAENLLAVRVDNKVPSSRWYSGSGLYREVSLSVLPKVHFEDDQVNLSLIAPTDDINQGLAALALQFDLSQLVSPADYQVSLRLWEQTLGSQNRQLVYQQAEQSLQDLAEVEPYGTTITLPRVNLWSPDQPHLYDLELTLWHQGQTCDVFYQETGFRQIVFDANQGLLVNGKATKIKGVCLHHDQGGLGACAYQDAIARQLTLLKAMGANTIRSTHNPSSPKLRQLANRLGFFVIEEAFDTWTYAKNGNVNDLSRYFHQAVGEENAAHLKRVHSQATSWAQYSTEAMVWSAKHDPSVLMWSVGNELMEGFSADVSHYPDVMRSICQWLAVIDTSRPITFADNKLKESDFYWNKQATQMAELLSQLESPQGVVGLNYANGDDYDRLHQQHPHWIIYGSETASAINSRSYYQQTKKIVHDTYGLTSYDYATVDWGAVASQAWYDTITRDFVAGECVWTGFDYLGEPTPWNKIDSGAADTWPSPKNAYFGILDTAGFPKDSYYFYQSQWANNQTTLHLLPAWREDCLYLDDQGLVEVVVYSNATSVQLLFEDEQGGLKNYGTKVFDTGTTPMGYAYQLYQGDDASETPHENLYLTWRIPYQKGLLRAVAYDASGKQIQKTSGRSQVRTYGAVAQLTWQAFEAPFETTQELLYLELSLLDKSGELVSHAQELIRIEVEGPAQLLALDNGNPVDHTLYHLSSRQAYGGKLLVILALTGEAGQVKVSAYGSGDLRALFQKEVSKRVSQEYLLTTFLDKYPLREFPMEKTISFGQLTTDVSKTHTNNRVQEKELRFDKGHFSVMTYWHALAWPLSFTPYKAYGDLGQDIILPEWLQATDAQGHLVKKAFPITWDFTTKTFTQSVVIRGQANCYGHLIPVEARLSPRQEEKRRHQDISLVAKQSLLASSRDRLTYRYQYATIQALGAISLRQRTTHPLTLNISLRSASQSSVSQISLEQHQVQVAEQETVIFLEEVMDVLQLDITLELVAGRKGDLEQAGLQIGLWDLV